LAIDQPQRCDFKEKVDRVMNVILSDDDLPVPTGITSWLVTLHSMSKHNPAENSSFISRSNGKMRAAIHSVRIFQSMTIISSRWPGSEPWGS
jgi:hypothetical protein